MCWLINFSPFQNIKKVMENCKVTRRALQRLWSNLLFWYHLQAISNFHYLDYIQLFQKEKCEENWIKLCSPVSILSIVSEFVIESRWKYFSKFKSFVLFSNSLCCWTTRQIKCGLQKWNRKETVPSTKSRCSAEIKGFAFTLVWDRAEWLKNCPTKDASPSFVKLNCGNFGASTAFLAKRVKESRL